MKNKQYTKYIGVFLGLFCIAQSLVLALIFMGVDINIGHKILVDKKEYQIYQEMKELSFLRSEIDKKYYSDFDKGELETGAIKGMFSSLPDGYSQFFTKEELKAKKLRENGESIGIGIFIGLNSQEEYVILSLEEGRPAQKSGLEEGDVLVAINGETITKDNIEKLLETIRNSNKKYKFFGDYPKVEVTIKRAGVPMVFKVPVDKSQIKSVSGEIMGDMGYIQIESFISTTSEDFILEIQKLKKAGITKLIIDLRNNPGGLVDEAAKVAGSLIGDEILYYTRSVHEKEEEHKSNTSKIFEGNVVVLVNEYSASASELVTAALKEYNIANVVGSRTFGKGIIQTTYTLANGSGYKLTTKEYLTPHQGSIHQIGIEPDYQVLEDERQLEVAKEILLNDHRSISNRK